MRKLLTLLALMLLSAVSWAQGLTVTGTVLDEEGLPLPGASVIAPNSRQGSMAGPDGKYSITLKKEDTVLQFDFLGYETMTVVVDGRRTIDVTMKPDASTTLNDVVVIGYGQAKKTDLTGSVSLVKMDEIIEAPTTSIDQALQGKVAGMDVMSTTGEPGAGTSIRLRGTRSIEASNEPLIVIDGVMDAVMDLNEINPDDIESISILKDASSTAIYGSRGANGVVIITTKKGVTARPRVTAKATFGVSRLARKLDVMNTEELIRYRNDYTYLDYYIYHPDASAPTAAYDVADFKNDTDWLDEVTRTAFTKTANVSVSGKGNGTSYFASAGINDTQGIVDGSGFSRATGRFNITHEFAKWLSLGLKATLTYAKENPNKANIGGTNVYTGVVYLAPFIGATDEVNPLYENGTKINTPRNAINLIDYHKERQNSSISGEITLKPLAGLVIKSQNTYTPHHVHVFKYSPSTLPARYDGQGGLVNRTEYNAIQLMSENTLTWTKKFGKGHSFEGMAGFSASSKDVDQMIIAADGILDDNLKWNNLNAVSTKEGYTNNSNTEKIVRESLYTRLNYNYKGKYYLTFTARADGSSNFAANNKWGFFPSAALKWNVSKERFMRAVPQIDNLSLRLSAGRTGNDAIAAYRSLGVYASSTSGAVFEGTQSAGFYPSRVENPNLTWEKTTLFNAGIDLSLFKERISLTLEAYSSYTTDLLLTLKTIQSTGFSDRYTNLGRTSNRGIELTLGTKNIVTRNWGWSTEFTLSHNSQMVEDIGHEEYVSVMEGSGFMIYGYKSGYPLNALWGFQYEGVFHNVEEVMKNQITHSYVGQTALSSDNPNYYVMLGRAKYADVNRDGNLSTDDLRYLGSADPVLYGGLQNTFNYKRLKLGVYLAYSLGGKIYNWSEFTMSGGYYTNQYRYMTDAWHPVRNPESNYPRAGIGERHVPSSLQVHDASYLRLKTVNLAYTFDFTKKRKSFMRSLTVGITGENLFLLTPYNGFDPDVSTSSETSTIRRADIGAYPKARTFVLNLQMNF